LVAALVDERKGQLVDAVDAAVVSQGGQTRNIMAADALVSSLVFLVSRTMRCNEPPPQWGSIGVRLGVHVACAILVTYSGARAEGCGVAVAIPVGIVVILTAIMGIIITLTTGLCLVGFLKATLAGSGGIVGAVVAVVVVIGGGSAVAMVAITGWIVKATIAVIVVP
jgi:hypothetical protein